MAKGFVTAAEEGLSLQFVLCSFGPLHQVPMVPDVLRACSGVGSEAAGTRNLTSTAWRYSARARLRLLSFRGWSERMAVQVLSISSAVIAALKPNPFGHRHQVCWDESQIKMDFLELKEDSVKILVYHMQSGKLAAHSDFLDNRSQNEIAARGT
jgi:hypothetical protein